MSNTSSQVATSTAVTGPRDVIQFDPKHHITFDQPPKSLTMKDIGYADNVGISPIAVTMPFPLFSAEAIQAMRLEISKPEVTKNHIFSSNLAAAQLRGYAREHAPFTYAAWNHPETISIVSKLAGIDLVPVGDYEVAHINLSVKSEEQAKAEQKAIQQRKRVHADEGIDMGFIEDETPIVGWHRDSYPFVCVLMMSDCTDMVGGETALRTATGEVIRVRGPTEGCAVILQGRYITHQALRALGAKERITAVTSWRPASPFVKDDTVLRTVRPVSDLSELYYDFAGYRLDMLEARMKQEKMAMAARRQSGEQFDSFAHKSFLEESIAFMHHTNHEVVAEDKVRRGSIATINIPNVIVGDRTGPSAKRGRSE